MAELAVYVADDCWNCAETERIVKAVISDFPALTVRVVSGARSKWPSYIFAAPTYVLDGRVVSLGNPDQARLYEWLCSALGGPT